MLTVIIDISERARTKASTLMAQSQYSQAISIIIYAQNMINQVANKFYNADRSFLKEFTKQSHLLDMLLAQCYFHTNQLILAYNTYIKLVGSDYILRSTLLPKIEECKQAMGQRASYLIQMAHDNTNHNNVQDRISELKEAQQILVALGKESTNELIEAAKDKINQILWEQARNKLEQICDKLLKNKPTPLTTNYLTNLRTFQKLYSQHKKYARENDRTMLSSLEEMISTCEAEFSLSEQLKKQARILQLLKTTKESLEQGNIPLAKDKISKAYEILKELISENLTPEIKELLGHGSDVPNTVSKSFLLRLTKESLIILNPEAELFKKRAAGDAPNKLAQELVEAALVQIDETKGKDCLYKPQYDLLLETVRENLIKYWFKFDKRSEPLDFSLQLSKAILENIKSIGWIKWYEDRSRTHSIVSEKSAITGEKTLPLISLIPTIFEQYQPEELENPLDLPLFVDIRNSPSTPTTQMFSRGPKNQRVTSTQTVNTSSAQRTAARLLA